MRLLLTIIAVAINIIVFVTLAAFLISPNYKHNALSIAFFLMLEAGIALNTILICTARWLMLLAFSMRIIPFFIIERVKPIIKPEGYAYPIVERYASKYSLHPT